MEPTPDTIAMFKDLVYTRSHLCFPESREAQFRRWLAQRVEEGKHRSFNEYYEILRNDAQEFDRLIALITTRETYFFRMPEQFLAMQEFVLPEIAEREGREAIALLSRGRQHRMRLRAWSAGCATGQETYSLAMQIVDGIRYPKAWDLEVVGTDINAGALEIAKAGRYDRMRMGRTPAEFLERYFIPAPDGENDVAIAGEVRHVTSFQVLNLRNLDREEPFRNYFDIIFCRNVMIYFDLPAQQRLVTALSHCLKPGGYLFTGEGEVLHLYHHSLELIERSGCVFYKRPEDKRP